MTTTSTRSLHWSLEGVIALAALVLAYFYVLRSIDTGSLLMYAAVIVLLAIAFSSAKRAVIKYRKGTGHRGEK